MKRVTVAIVPILALTFEFTVAKCMADGMMPKSGEASEVSKLIGATIKDPHGEDLGKITDVVTGPEGRFTFAVVSYWISDDTQKRIAVPIGALSCEEQNCILNGSKDTLDSAPTFFSEDDLVEPKMAGDIYRYFAIPPYWTEEGSKK